MTNKDMTSEWGEWALYAEGEGDDRTDQSEDVRDRGYTLRNPGNVLLVGEPSLLELELMFNNSTVKESCAFCGFVFRTEWLQVFWERRAVCDDCMPVEMRDLRDIGYEWAKEVSIDADGGIREYLDALSCIHGRGVWERRGCPQPRSQ